MLKNIENITKSNVSSLKNFICVTVLINTKKMKTILFSKLDIKLSI